MRIDFKNPENKRQLTTLRSQIKNSEDLRKFDDFLSKNDSFDFENSEQVAAARGCCAGENCCSSIKFEIKLSAV